MKNLLLILSFLISSIAVAQKTIEDYVKQGIEYHDAGKYEMAIEVYQQALLQEENSVLVIYEMAMTYMYMKQYENALKHASTVINLDDKYLMQAYVAKGNCLDALGKSGEAIKTYKKAIKKIGDNYMLYYNLGLTYYNQGKLKEAEESITNAIKNNPNHPSSHLLLGYLMNNQGNKVQSILALHYFLFLEPNSGRSSGVFELLKKQFSGNVERTGPTDISILLSPESMDKKTNSDLLK